MPEDEWDKLIKTNLTGSWLIPKHVCRRMNDAKLKGSVINISSVAGLNRGHLPGSTGYTSSKSAMHYVTKLMALELGAYGIRVNSIAPGIFKSEIAATLLQKRWLILIHETSSYVSGNIFIVDSGASLPGVPIFSSL
ncbi:hypothetical protein ABZP36_024779 [Zizania latifolia]